MSVQPSSREATGLEGPDAWEAETRSSSASASSSSASTGGQPPSAPRGRCQRRRQRQVRLSHDVVGLNQLDAELAQVGTGLPIWREALRGPAGRAAAGGGHRVFPVNPRIAAGLASATGWPAARATFSTPSPWPTLCATSTRTSARWPSPPRPSPSCARSPATGTDCWSPSSASRRSSTPSANRRPTRVGAPAISLWGCGPRNYVDRSWINVASALGLCRVLRDQGLHIGLEISDPHPRCPFHVDQRQPRPRR
jgi:hypothetical protein